MVGLSILKTPIAILWRDYELRLCEKGRGHSCQLRPPDFGGLFLFSTGRTTNAKTECDQIGDREWLRRRGDIGFFTFAVLTFAMPNAQATPAIAKGKRCSTCHAGSPPSKANLKKSELRPTTGVAGCCACEATGQAAPEPTITLMKSRRRIAFLKAWDHANRMNDYSGDLRHAEWASGVSLHSSNPEPLMSALGQKQTSQ